MCLWGHPHSQNYPRLPESQVSGHPVFISRWIHFWQGAGKDMDSGSAEDLLVSYSSPALVDKRLTASQWLVSHDTPRPESTPDTLPEAMPPPWNLLCRQKEPGTCLMDPKV